jgi:hypothetical protein
MPKLKWVFKYWDKEVKLGKFDPSYPEKKLDRKLRYMQQELFDQIEDSGVFTKNELNLIYELDTEKFLGCITRLDYVPLIYIAAPYSHDDKLIVDARVVKVMQTDANLIRKGFVTVTPLSKHFILNVGDQIPGDWDYWKRYSITLLKKCDEMFVLPIEGWRESEGVQDEIAYAKKKGKPVRFVNELGEFINVD